MRVLFRVGISVAIFAALSSSITRAVASVPNAWGSATTKRRT